MLISKPLVRRLSVFVVLCSLFIVSWAQTPFFTPSSPISPFGSVSSPGGEEFFRIIDGNVNTKFLDFNRFDGMGFTVDAGTPGIATQIRVTTANDFPERDPSSVTISGSNNNSTFSTIATINIPCINNRFFARTFNFTNSTSYRYYRIVYNNPCIPNFANSLQVSETRSLAS